MQSLPKNKNSWNAIESLFGDFMQTIRPANRKRYDLEELKKVLKKDYPKLYADPMRVVKNLSWAGERELNHSFPWDSELRKVFDTFIKLTQIAVKIEDALKSKSAEPIQFTSTHVSVCAKTWLIQQGYIPSYNFIQDEIFSLDAQREDGKETEFCFVRSISSVYKGYDYKGIARKDIGLVRNSIGSGVLQMMEKQREKKNMRCCMFFADNEATRELMMRYIPAMKKIGFEIYGVQSPHTIKVY
jgi:hypothetical protein